MSKRRLILSLSGAAAASLIGLSTSAMAQQCTSYGHSPTLDAQVADAGLRPVTDRLQTKLLVVEDVNGVGRYGGEMIDINLESRIGDHRHNGYDPLVRWSPDGSKILSNVAESWTISDHASTYRRSLREGLCWSYGNPFTARETVFWREHVETIREINSRGPRRTCIVEGDPAAVKPTDECTVESGWSAPNGEFSLDNASPYGQRVVQFAEHGITDFMKELNPDGLAQLMAEAGETEFGKFWIGGIDTCRHNVGHNDPGRPTPLSWEPTEPVSGKERFTFERNSCYLKVDGDGNQLPYIDRRSWILAKDHEAQVSRTTPGEFDISPAAISTPTNRAALYDNQDCRDCRLTRADSCNFNDTQFLFSMNHSDPMKAEVVQNKDFRIGPSLGMDRTSIIDAVHLGQGEPFQAGTHPNTPCCNEQLARQCLNCSPGLAAEHLDRVLSMGPEGIRFGSDSEPFTFIVLVNDGSRPEWVDIAQIVERNRKDLGLNVIVEVVSDELHQARQGEPNREVKNWAGENGCGHFLAVNPQRKIDSHGNWSPREAGYARAHDPEAKMPEVVTPAMPSANAMRDYELSDLVPTRACKERASLMDDFMSIETEEFRPS